MSVDLPLDSQPVGEHVDEIDALDQASGRRQRRLLLVRLEQPPERDAKLLVAEIPEPRDPPGGAQQAFLLERRPEPDPGQATAEGVRQSQRARRACGYGCPAWRRITASSTSPTAPSVAASTLSGVSSCVCQYG